MGGISGMKAKFFPFIATIVAILTYAGGPEVMKAFHENWQPHWKWSRA
jgi:hypothetical protein